jgi:MFS family permease
MTAGPAARDGRTRGLLRGNVLWLSAVSLLNDAASEMIYPLLPLFLAATLGAGPAALGALEGVTESASSFLKLAGGRLADRTGRRKPLMTAGYAIAALARPLIALVTAPWQVVAIRLADRVGKGLRSAPRDALLAESVPAARRGAAFGLHRAADHAGAVVGPLLASALLLAFPGDLRLVFGLAVIPGLVTVAVLAWKVREDPVSPAPPSDASDRDAPPPASLAVSGSETGVGDGDDARRLRRYLVVLFVFTLGNASDAFLLLRARELGVAVAAVPLLWGALHVSKLAWNVVGGRLGDRIGPVRAIVAGWAVYAAVYAGFAAADAAWHAWALFLVYGLFYGLTEGPEKALVAALAPRERRGGAFGAYHLAIGIGALPASLAFGVVWQTFGAAAAFGMGAGLALLAALALVAVAPGEREMRAAT